MITWDYLHFWQERLHPVFPDGWYQTIDTDAGIQHLKSLTNLKELCVTKTQVTDDGVEKLQQALPNCKVEQ